MRLDDVAARTQTSKGQIFHYFPGGREELLLAVAHHEADRVLEDQQPYLGHLTSWSSWQSWRDAVVERYRKQGRLCPLGALVAQVGRNSPGAQAVTATLISSWTEQVAAGIRAMQSESQVDRGLNAEEAAKALVAGIQGGVTMMLSTGELTYLEAALDVAIERLRKSSLSGAG
jgi:AcrR family transcriptional regulator